jgi:chromosome segregation ATPase
MTGRGLLTQEGGRRVRREVIDVPERQREDRRLDQLLHVRKQRLSRLERERNEARQSWRDLRGRLRQAKQHWRDMRASTQSQWQQSRTEFLQMTLTSGQFSRAKSVYKRMQEETAQLYLQCQEWVERCNQARMGFFEARRKVREANRQQEKLSVLRDEMRARTQIME